MNQFEIQLMQLDADANKIKEKEKELQHHNVVFTEKLQAFLKEHGLPETWTLPQALLLAIRQSRK